jgi:aldehyde dehydrogenase (NAD+)
MVSFTGSTRAGRLVAQAGAETIKRVTQELGGKSANIILDDADLKRAVTGGVQSCFTNSGQSCNAPTRMFVPEGKLAEAVEIARAAAEQVKVGAPGAEGTIIGPVVSKTQFDKIQGVDRDRHQGRCKAGHRRPGPSRRPEEGLLREADRVCERA